MSKFITKEYKSQMVSQLLGKKGKFTKRLLLIITSKENNWINNKHCCVFMGRIKFTIDFNKCNKNWILGKYCILLLVLFAYFIILCFKAENIYVCCACINLFLLCIYLYDNVSKVNGYIFIFETIIGKHSLYVQVWRNFIS